MINESVQKIIQELSPQRSPILEAVLGTVLQHMAGKVDAETGETLPVAKNPHFAILTSWRKFDWKEDPGARSGDEKIIGQKISRRFGSSAARSKEINQKNYSDLIKHFQGLGLPVVRLTGSWLETGNRISTDPFERSIFVVGDKSGKEADSGLGKLNLGDIQSLGKKYNQDSIIYAGPDAGEGVHLYGQDRESGTWSQWSSWKNIKVDAASTIAKKLSWQKLKLLGGTIGRWLGFERNPKNDTHAGATQVGGEGRGKIRLPFMGKSITDPEASDKGFSFVEGIIERLCFPCDYPHKRFEETYKQYGMSPADMGVGLLDLASDGHYKNSRNLSETILSAKLIEGPIHLDRINEVIDEIANRKKP